MEIDEIPSLKENPNKEKKDKSSKGSKRLTELSHGGGCGCKIDPAALDEILAHVPKTASTADLLVGIEHSDDAAVYRVSDDYALVFTNDFFTPMVDDPYLYGRIAAANALSDIYAMGGEPMLANAIVGFPVNELSVNTMQQIMQGGVDVCVDAGIPLSGGHSIDNPQPIFGLAAIGKVNPKQIKTNSNSKVGDVLLLTKPIGIGVLASAFKIDEISSEGYKAFVENITMLNKSGAWLGQQDSVHAMTDITGFGLAGHLIEMAHGANVSMEVHIGAVPIIPEALAHVVEGIVPGGAYRNMENYSADLKFPDDWDIDKQLLFTDPQTNGGLLVSIDPVDVERVIKELKKQGSQQVTVVGEVTEARKDNIAVNFIS